MATPPPQPDQPPVVTIPVAGPGDANVPQDPIPVGGDKGFGDVILTPPTFLEKWGVVFVSVAGVWILLVCAWLILYYAHQVPAAPVQSAGVPPDTFKAMLDLHKTQLDQFRDSVNFIFDLTVTKTILPVLTLLLGYLFGSKKG